MICLCQGYSISSFVYRATLDYHIYSKITVTTKCFIEYEAGNQEQDFIFGTNEVLGFYKALMRCSSVTEAIGESFPYGDKSVFLILTLTFYIFIVSFHRL